MCYYYLFFFWGGAFRILWQWLCILPEYKGNSYPTICSMFVATISILSYCTIKQKEPRALPRLSSELFILGNKVPGAGIEPARVLPHWCLRPTRLPIPPSGL